MGLTDFPAEVVKKFNVHYIEPHSHHFRSLDSRTYLPLVSAKHWK